MSLVSSLVLVFLVVGSICLSEGQFNRLTVGFYDQTCPNAEAIVRAVVREAALSDSNMPAVLLRLHFHDCFVEGCDGSILIDNGKNAEKNAFGHEGVRGFEVIDKAKAQLEATCHGVVSCADIVALAARDAISLAGGPSYEVPTGRIDGVVSNLSLAGDMPDVSDSIQQLKAKFRRKGLSEKDLVTLSAAHTIGTTACFFMTKRLYNFFPGGGSDPTINPILLQELKAKCPQNGDVNVRVPIDRGSEEAFDIHILQNIRNGFGVLESDAKLNGDETTSSIIDSYFGFFPPPFGPSFEADFVESIIKMGQIGIKTSLQGGVRRICSSFS
uniref:peroxidase 43-like n=1 Tax=Fragaria vesca subsp. vesca TaxID=101020 RepID=UPI0005C97F22|nr:PREDICTED: peroxidase 43-like [Fragaria vesca subsp. vesca]